MFYKIPGVHYILLYRSLCMKDQLDAYLPQLLEIQTGLERCGIHDSIRNGAQLQLQAGAAKLELTVLS